VRRRRARRALTVNTDLKLMPLMNIIIALIPMLLLSAVFIEIKVVETSLPRDAGGAVAAARTETPLDLALHVRANLYVIEGHGIAPVVIVRGTSASAPDSATAMQLVRVLESVVASHPGTRDVRIVAEARTRYQEVISLMDTARAAGLVNASLEGASAEDV